MPLVARARRPRAATAVLVLDETPLVPGLAGAGIVASQADIAVTLEQARQYLRRRRYGLVLCSFALARQQAPALLSEVTRAQPGTPCLFFTGAPDPEQVRRLLAEPRPAEPLPALNGSGVLGETVRALVRAIDARDPANALHSHRVTQLALRLGEALRLPERDLWQLELAALLHDVGKLAVPLEVLAKPGPLDQAEWDLMRRHPVCGAEIVAQVEGLEEIAGVVRHHHERVDGRGYPDGLCGEQIPLLSRIITIADAYEAMTADRVYRPALSCESACEQIRAGLDSQFDSRFGRAFLQLTGLP
jgi:putative nucleotidyltransferase with HDIG domain